VLIILILALVTSFYLLSVLTDDYFVDSLLVIAKKLRLRPDVTGATLMAAGSSTPELFTALIAVFRHNGVADIGTGTIVGSAIFNVLVIIGLVALVNHKTLQWQPIVRDLIFYFLLLSILLFSFWDGKITLIEASIFVTLYVIYIFAVVNWKKWLHYRSHFHLKREARVGDVEGVVEKHPLAQAARWLLGLVVPDCEKHPKLYWLTFLMSITLIGVLSYLLVESAMAIGGILNIHPTIIALTVLAAGTSVPDLLSSVFVAKRNQGDMAISNALGSNIFNISFGLGFPWLLILLFQGKTVTVAVDNLMGASFLLFSSTVMVLVLLFARHWRLGKSTGAIMIAIYLGYLLWEIWRASSGL